MKMVLAKFFFLLCFSASLMGYPFSDNGDGSVSDTSTNLVWQKCSRGQNADSTCTGTATKTTWSLALLHCKNLSLGQRIWRLPNINEMRSLVNPAIFSRFITPYIDSISFPSTVRDKYWSSSTMAGSAGLAYFVDFSDGSQDTQNKVTAAFVRCVSGP
jgi:hypothetical protein